MPSIWTSGFSSFVGVVLFDLACGATTADSSTVSCAPVARPAGRKWWALLSLGHPMIGSELSSLLGGVGYDPYMGFYHHPDYDRPCLALDLPKEFRFPAVDRLVLNLTNLLTL